MRHLILFLTIAGAPLLCSGASPIQWTADLNHCRAQFTVSHMVVSRVWGHIPIRQLTVVNDGNSGGSSARRRRVGCEP